MSDLLWPKRDEPEDLAAIEAVPLADRGLPESTYTLLFRAARLWPERLALSVLTDATRFEQPVQRTFAELLADVHRTANLFHALGVRRRDAVALLSPNCDELITATLAAQLAGIAAPINSGLSYDHITHLLRQSGARVLVAAGPDLDEDAWRTARRLARSGAVDAVVVLRPSGQAARTALEPSGPVTMGYLSELTRGHPDAAFVGTAPAATDIASMFHTGGTTGAPKLAAHTHGNEVSDAWMIALVNSTDNGATVFAALPLFHVNALVVTVLAPLLRGQQVVWAGPLGYRDTALFGQFWKLVEHYRVVAMSAVPTVYAALAGRPVDADVSSLRMAIVGASPLPEAVRHRFESATGIHLLQGYGLTEATCASAVSLPTERRPGSVGQRLPYQQVKAVHVASDRHWEDLPTGEVGTLAISGPTVFPGYVVGRDASGPLLDGLGTVRDGWLDTGDLGRVDVDGFVHLTGRAKDIIIRGGHNIDPALVEQALLSHPAVTAALAVGRPDAHAGEVPVGFVTLAPGARVSADELCAWAGEHVAERAAAPKDVTVLDALPVTAVGKPHKLPLRAEATRHVVTNVLSGLDHVVAVRGLVQDGSVVAEIEGARGLDEAAVKDALDPFPIHWRVAVRP